MSALLICHSRLVIICRLLRYGSHIALSRRPDAAAAVAAAFARRQWRLGSCWVPAGFLLGSYRVGPCCATFATVASRLRWYFILPRPSHCHRTCLRFILRLTSTVLPPARSASSASRCDNTAVTAAACRGPWPAFFIPMFGVTTRKKDTRRHSKK